MFENIPIKSITLVFSVFDKKYVKQTGVVSDLGGNVPMKTCRAMSRVSNSWNDFYHFYSRVSNTKHWTPLLTVSGYIRKINDTLHKTRIHACSRFNFINLWARSHLLDGSFKLEWFLAYRVSWESQEKFEMIIATWIFCVFTLTANRKKKVRGTVNEMKWWAGLMKTIFGGNVKNDKNKFVKMRKKFEIIKQLLNSTTRRVWFWFILFIHSFDR